MLTELNDSESDSPPPVLYEPGSLLLSLYYSPLLTDVADVPLSESNVATRWQACQILRNTLLQVGPYLTASLVVIFSVEAINKVLELFFGSIELTIFRTDTS